MTKTKEGIEVLPGQVWRDLDKRMSGGNRHCRVVLVGDNHAYLANCLPDGTAMSERLARVAIRRMHKTSTGWSLVMDIKPAQGVK